MLAGMDSILFRARVLIYGTVSQALIYGTVSQALITTKLKDSPFTKVLVEGRIFFTELLIGDKKVFHDIFINLLYCRKNSCRNKNNSLLYTKFQ